MVCTFSIHTLSLFLNVQSFGEAQLKTAIFAGGKGSRLIEETRVRPKPLVEIANRPILWHIMQHYSTYGHHEFVLALGYMGDLIKRYISDLCQYDGNLRIDFAKRELFGEPDYSNGVNDVETPPWTVDLIDTGMDTMTGGRLARLEPYLGGETFMLTYGDGVSNVDLDALLAFHRSHGKLATITMVRPLTTFGHLQCARGRDGRRVHGKAGNRGRLDQWRLFRAGARSVRCRRQRQWRRDYVGRRPPAQVDGVGAVDGIPPSRVLVLYGSPGGQTPA